MRLKVTATTAQYERSIEPYKYYVWPGEIIYKYKDLIHNKYYFKHVDKDGVLLFRSEELKNLISCSYELEKEDKIDAYFSQMVSEATRDISFEDDLKFIKNSSKKDPIIIGGCGRSGTTLLLSILGSHSSIFAMNEETYAFYPHPYRLSRLRYVIEKYKIPSNKRWCEKTPKNVMVFDKIYKIFDGHVKLIHIVRDGRDVITSVHPYHKGNFWVNQERWIEDVGRGLEHEKITCLVKYEDLVMRPRETMEKLCLFIGEPFENSLIDYANHTTIKNNVAWDSIISPLHSNGIGRWNSPEYCRRIGEFMENKNAINLMKKIGYL